MTAVSPGIPLARYRFSFRTCSGPPLQSQQAGYLGSAWHGAFGHALKDVVCTTHLPQCEDCPLLLSCPYPLIFMNKPPPDAQQLRLYTRTPQPHVLQPASDWADRKGEYLQLGVILYGTANKYFPQVLKALQTAAQRGLTTQRVPLALVDVQAENLAGHSATGAENGIHPWKPVAWDSQTPHPTPLAKPPPPPALDLLDELQIDLLSPLRIREDGHYVSASNFRFRAFMANVLRRTALLAHFFSDHDLDIDFKALLQQAETLSLQGSTLHWQKLSRYSSRQKQKLPMGGLTGHFRLSTAKLTPFWPWLWLGQWTHVGKMTTMGMGRYLIKPVGHTTTPWPAPSKL